MIRTWLSPHCAKVEQWSSGVPAAQVHDRVGGGVYHRARRHQVHGGGDVHWRPHGVHRPEAILSPESTASNAALLATVVVTPHSDVAWLEPHRYYCVVVAAKVTSFDASPQEERVTNVAVASHGSPTWTSAICGPVPEAEIIGAAAYLLHTPPSALTVHVVDASIIGAQLRRAQEALYRGITGPTSHFSNQHALNWVVEGLCRLPRRVGGPPSMGGAAELALGGGPARGIGLRCGPSKGPAGTPHVTQGTLPTMQVMRQWRQKISRTVIPALPCIFCGGPEEDTGHLCIPCETDKAVERLLCAKVEEFTADLPLADKAMEFMSWKEHGCRWTESLMAGVVPGELKRLFAAVRVVSSRGPAKAKLFLEDMVLIGEDG